MKYLKIRESDNINQFTEFQKNIDDMSTEIRDVRSKIRKEVNKSKQIISELGKNKTDYISDFVDKFLIMVGFKKVKSVGNNTFYIENKRERNRALVNFTMYKNTLIINEFKFQSINNIGGQEYIPMTDEINGEFPQRIKTLKFSVSKNLIEQIIQKSDMISKVLNTNTEVFKTINESFKKFKMPKFENIRDELKYRNLLHDLNIVLNKTSNINKTMNINKYLKEKPCEQGEIEYEIQKFKSPYDENLISFKSDYSEVITQKDEYYKFDILKFIKSPILVGTDYSDVIDTEDILKRIMIYFDDQNGLEGWVSPFLIDPNVDINKIYKDINEGIQDVIDDFRNLFTSKDIVSSSKWFDETRRLSNLIDSIDSYNINLSLYNDPSIPVMYSASTQGIIGSASHTYTKREYHKEMKRYKKQFNKNYSFVVKQENDKYKFDIKSFMKNYNEILDIKSHEKLDFLNLCYKIIISKYDDKVESCEQNINGNFLKYNKDGSIETMFLENPQKVDTFQVMKDINEGIVDNFKNFFKPKEKEKLPLSTFYDSIKLRLNELINNVDLCNSYRALYNKRDISNNSRREHYKDMLRHKDQLCNIDGDLYSFIVEIDYRLEYRIDLQSFMKNYSEIFDIEDDEKMEFLNFCLEVFVKHYKLMIQLSKENPRSYDKNEDGTISTAFLHNPEVDTFQVMKDINESKEDFRHKKEWKIQAFVSEEYDMNVESILRVIFNYIVRHNRILLNGYKTKSTKNTRDLIDSFRNDNDYIFMVRQKDDQVKFDISKFVTDYDDMFPNIKDQKSFIKKCMKLFVEIYNNIIDCHDSEYDGELITPFLEDPVININQVFTDINNV